MDSRIRSRRVTHHAVAAQVNSVRVERVLGASIFDNLLDGLPVVAGFVFVVGLVQVLVGNDSDESLT